MRGKTRENRELSGLGEDLTFKAANRAKIQAEEEFWM
jgi:hypothetical protein